MNNILLHETYGFLNQYLQKNVEPSCLLDVLNALHEKQLTHVLSCETKTHLEKILPIELPPQNKLHPKNWSHYESPILNIGEAWMVAANKDSNLNIYGNLFRVKIHKEQLNNRHPIPIRIVQFLGNFIREDLLKPIGHYFDEKEIATLYFSVSPYSLSEEVSDIPSGTSFDGALCVALISYLTSISPKQLSVCSLSISNTMHCFDEVNEIQNKQATIQSELPNGQLFTKLTGEWNGNHGIKELTDLLCFMFDDQATVIQSLQSKPFAGHFGFTFEKLSEEALGKLMMDDAIPLQCRKDTQISHLIIKFFNLSGIHETSIQYLNIGKSLKHFVPNNDSFNSVLLYGVKPGFLIFKFGIQLRNKSTHFFIYNDRSSKYQLAASTLMNDV